MMKAGSFFQLLLVISASLMLAGCKESIIYTIYNNTPWNLVVELKDGEEAWVAGTPLRIDKDIQGRMQWLREGGQHFPVLTIRRDEIVSYYKFTSPEYPVPEEYAAKRRGGVREYRFQLQQDWNLYLMRPEDSYPAPGRHLRLQPPGFPKGRAVPESEEGL